MRKEHERVYWECWIYLSPDQKRAIEEIVADFRSGNMMDRLLSGDVGFGKSEIAMNAIFIAYKLYQSSLCSTTILSSQHYRVSKREFWKLYGVMTRIGTRLIDFSPQAKEEKRADLWKGLDGRGMTSIVGYLGNFICLFCVKRGLSDLWKEIPLGASFLSMQFGG